MRRLEIDGIVEGTRWRAIWEDSTGGEGGEPEPPQWQLTIDGVQYRDRLLLQPYPTSGSTACRRQLEEVVRQWLARRG
jgi:hypothetical protein